MNVKAEKFINLLKEIFEVDKSDLDFGIYRIMNHKRDVINKFLEEDLINEISNQVKIINGDNEIIENNVYTHLVNFFSRYYEEGDFISKRRYKDGIYVIPYEGEEVKLHWANNDQYYIKSSENFKDYSFKVEDKTIHFKLVEATTELNNNKSINESKFFVLSDTEDFIEVEGNNLIIKFQFKSLPKSNRQEKLNSEIIEKINKKLIENPNLQEFLIYLHQIKPTEKNKKRTLLEKELSTYTSKNSFDYFIHKDLDGFLRREIDFYIKNEMLSIDDSEMLDEKNIRAQLDQIKIVKNIGEKIISFLAQIENFQKKLWLKKKFVVETNYCITLDRIDERFYEEILANKEQQLAWKKLFLIEEPINLENIIENKYLIVDTKFFDEEFKEKLIASIKFIDENCDGLMIHSDNYQALNLLQKKYDKNIDVVYGDPPYNAKSSEILYKNSFKHSSWLSFMTDRLMMAKNLKNKKGSLITAIDENEFVNLLQVLNGSLTEWENDCISIIHNPAGVQGDNFSYSHEYAIFSFESGKDIIGKTDREEQSEESFRDWGGTCLRTLAKNCFYPIYVKDNTIIGFGDVCEDDFHPESSNINEDGRIAVYPISDDGEERKWVFARDSVESIIDDLVVKNNNGKISISRIKTKTSYKTVWTNKKYYANIYGSKLLNNIMGTKKFDFPKSIYTVEDCLLAVNSFRRKDSIALDYFAGSGTTANAVININRNDNGRRKFILIEMGNYFDIVTKPRVEKIIYSKEWKNGKPIDRDGISQMFKYLELEQYEDSLNNIDFRENEQLNIFPENIKEEYIINYMLDFETKDSSTYLNIDKLANPFEYKLKIERNGESKYRNIDLVETFNYLLGLNVEEISMKEAYSYDGFEIEKYFDGTFVFKRIEGKLKDGSKVLIVWRNLSGDIKTDNDVLNKYFNKKHIETNEYDYIYINGDNTIEIDGRDNYKIKLIDEEFKRLMFEDIE